MAITGVLNIGFYTSFPVTPTNTIFVIGEDGKHYIATAEQFEEGIAYIGQAEDKTVVTIDETQWRADLLASGAIAGITGDFFMSPIVIPCPGTAKFWILGAQPDYPTGGATDLSNNDFYVVGVRYKIDSTGTAIVDGGLLRRPAHTFVGRPLWGYVFGATVKDDSLYALVGLPVGFPAAYFIKLPLTGTSSDPTVGSWTAHITKLPTTLSQQTLFYFTNAATSNAINRAGILPLANGSFRIFSYLSWHARLNQPSVTWYSIPTTGCEFWDVDPVTHTVSTGPQDGRALFGQPWADSKTKYDDSVSSNTSSDYSAPNIQAVTGGYAIFFGRAFEDQLSTVRFREYFYDSNTGLITYVDTFDKAVSHVSLSPDVLQTAMYYREIDGHGIYAINYLPLWGFGEDVELPPPPPLAGTGRRWIAGIHPLTDD
jgi:hypothetical protein